VGDGGQRDRSRAGLKGYRAGGVDQRVGPHPLVFGRSGALKGRQGHNAQ
jgi:hypothetical protein